MNKSLIKIPTADMSREEWLKHRRGSIGGSDASAIIGLNPYSSPYTVWADKLGKLPEKEDNEAMRQGRDLESYVAQRFTEQTGKKVRRENNILINPDYPFAHANVDRIIVGENAGLECKTTSTLNLKKFKNGEYPDTYYVQCVHYMMVTGCKKWYLAVLVLGKDFMVFEINRDEEEIRTLAQAEKDFWDMVQSETLPPVDGTSSTTETIGTIYADSDDSVVNLFAYEKSLKEYLDIGKQINELKAAKDEIANGIKAFMKESSRGETDSFKVTWASSVRSSFDAKKFAVDHPDMDISKYYKQTNTRTFKVTEKTA
ncbi:MAG: YqaJ viral recombinase family protein [Oscillospiraceae bacterium]|nr:YqaJ viral recombinase family protein [Oscillospiraceae bacterium]